MNKKIYNEDLTLNLIINGDKMVQGNKKSLNELHKLDREMRRMQMNVAELELKKRKLDKTDANYERRLKSINNEIKNWNRQIEATERKMYDMRKEIGLSSLTLNQLNTHLKVLKVQLNNASDPRILKKLRREIQEVNFHIVKLRTGASRLSQAWTEMARKANRYAAVLGFTVGIFYSLGAGVQRLVARLSGLDRKLSEVMKTTELTREEAWKLKKVFDQMDTPTGTDELLDMAHVAGRLGQRGVEDISKFVRSVDVLNVALGRDLGLTADETTEAVGKLVNAFKLKEKLPIDDALLRMGSLLNELDKRSEASSGTILNYLTRLSGLANMADYGADKLGGMAATMNMIGIPAERGSTALRKLISSMGDHVDEFSRILGVSTEQYREMIDKDLNEVFLMLLQRTSEGDQSIVDMMKSMDAMDVSGVRVSETYSALSQNIEKIREQQGYASVAFQSGASVLSEFNIISVDFAANIDRENKRMRSLGDFMAKVFQPTLLRLYKGFVDFMYLLRDGIVWVGDHTGAIKALTAGLVALKATAIAGWLKKMTYELRFQVLAVRESIKAHIAHNSVLVATRNHGIRGMIVALRALWATMLANPLAPIIAALGILSAAFFLFKKRSDALKKVYAEMGAEMLNATTRAGLLFEKTKELSEGTEGRAAAIKRINELYGTYLPNLLTETSSNEDLAIAQEAVNAKIRERIALRFKDSAFEDEMAKRAKKVQKKSSNLLGDVNSANGAESYGIAMGQLDRLAGEVNSNYYGDPLIAEANSEAIRQYMEEWKLVDLYIADVRKKGSKVNYETEANRDLLAQSIERRIMDVIEAKHALQKEMQDMEATIDGYVKGMNSSSDPNAENSNLGPKRLSAEEFAALNKQSEVAYNKELTRLNNLALTRDALRKKEMQAEIDYTEELIKNAEQYNSNDEGVLVDLLLKKARLQQQYREEVANQKAKSDKEDEKAQKQEAKNAIDIEKMRAEAIADEKGKAIALEVDNHKKIIKELLEHKHEAGLMEEAIELETTRHNNAVADINLKAIDKTLKDNQLGYAEKYKALDDALAAEEILEADYHARIRALDLDAFNDQMASDAVSFAEKYLELEAALENELILYEEYIVRKQDLDSQVQRVKRRFGLVDKETEASEIALLKQSAEFQMLNAEQQGQAIANIEAKYQDKRLKRYEDHVQRVNEIARGGSEIVANLQGMELEALQDKVDRGVISEELAAKKKKAIQKKYADTTFALNVAEILSSTALAIMKTWEGYADMGPLGTVLAGIQTGVLTGMGATQLAVANQQRQRVKQLAKGRYPVIGEDDGKRYDAYPIQRANTGLYTSPTLVAERPEFVIDYPTLKNIQLNEPGILSSIMALRVPQYASGKYDTAGSVEKKHKAEPPQVIQVQNTLKLPLYTESDGVHVESLLQAFVKLSEYVDTIKKN